MTTPPPVPGVPGVYVEFDIRPDGWRRSIASNCRVCADVLAAILRQFRPLELRVSATALFVMVEFPVDKLPPPSSLEALRKRMLTAANDAASYTTVNG